MKTNDLIENLNCLKLFDYVFNNLSEPLTHQTIQLFQYILKKDSQLHRNIPEETGKYRTTYVSAGNLEGAPPYVIREKMENLIKDFQIRKVLLIDDIAEFHSRYESIHPFRDGNGRTGRMISFKQCLENGQIPFIVDNETRRQYIDSLSLSNKGDYKYIIEYCLQQQKAFVLKYQKHLDTNITQNKVTRNENVIINYLQKHKLARKTELEKITNLKSRATSNLLISMLKKNLIKKVGGSKNTHYSKVI